MNFDKPLNHDDSVSKKVERIPGHFHPVALANLHTVDLSQIQVVNAIQIPQTSLVTYSGVSQPSALLTGSEKVILNQSLSHIVPTANLPAQKSISVQCNLPCDNEEQLLSSELLGHLNKLRRCGQLCDFTLRIGSKSWTAHACIASAIPKLLPYMQNVKQFNQHVLQLNLPSCFTNDAMEFCLDYLYGEALPFDKNFVNNVYRLAMYLQYTNLVRRCNVFAKQNGIVFNQYPTDKSLPPPTFVTAPESAPKLQHSCQKANPKQHQLAQKGHDFKAQEPVNVVESIPEKVHPNSKQKQRKAQYQCDGCGRAFRWPHLLRRHFATVHLKLKPHKCEKCGRCFNRSEELKQHAASHTGVKNYTCRFCSKKFRHKASLFVHQKTHTDGQRYVCDVCGYASHTANVLRIHQQTHNKTLPHKCNFCTKRFKTPQYLRRHEKMHSKVTSNPIESPIT
uniref:ZF(BTB/C2H2) zinc finger protein n=1 Tax=Phallusia mammillata TaxID=59560 RepID=A0A6F9DY45_9ASCI|nr:ZF(BTB/C2H2) zinc finger protein [Phallusia mammillata]